MTNILVIDDLRSFRDDRSAEYARTSAEGLAVLALNAPYDEVWLDHDLGLLEDGTPDTIMPIVDEFSFRAFQGEPYPVGVIYVHTSNPVGAKQITASLTNYGYKVRQVYANDYFTVSE